MIIPYAWRALFLFTLKMQPKIRMKLIFGCISYFFEQASLKELTPFAYLKSLLQCRPPFPRRL